jgi:hypothetical protein
LKRRATKDCSAFEFSKKADFCQRLTDLYPQALNKPGDSAQAALSQAIYLKKFVSEAPKSGIHKKLMIPKGLRRLTLFSWGGYGSKLVAIS